MAAFRSSCASWRTNWSQVESCMSPTWHRRINQASKCSSRLTPLSYRLRLDLQRYKGTPTSRANPVRATNPSLIRPSFNAATAATAKIGVNSNHPQPSISNMGDMQPALLHLVHPPSSRRKPLQMGQCAGISSPFGEVAQAKNHDRTVLVRIPRPTAAPATRPVCSGSRRPLDAHAA